MLIALIGISKTALTTLALSARNQTHGANAAVLGALLFVLPAGASPIAGALVEMAFLPWLGALALLACLVLLRGLAAVRAASNGSRR